MSAPRFRTRLARQLLALLVPWSLFVTACLLLVFSGRAEQFQRERDQQATMVLAAECAPLAHADDLRALSGLVFTHMAALPALRYVLVLEPSGDLVWSSFAAGTPAGLLRLHWAGADAEGPTRVSLDGELIDDYPTRRSGLLVRAGYSAQPARDLARSMLPVLAGTGLVGLALVFALASYLSRPVEALTQAVAQAEDGGNPEVHAISETAEIAERFGNVVGRLAERDQQLEAARRLAQLGEVLATIAHDVNNPLGVVVLNAGFLVKRLERGELPEDSHKDVRRLWMAARRASLVVQRFLQIARWSTRPSRAVQRQVHMRTLVEEAIELLEERARRRHVSVELVAPQGLDPVLCDEQGVLQVLVNLLTNAMEASPAGGTVQVRIEVDGPWLAVSVIDQGPGLTPEVAARATEPFFTTKERGTGLGLAICDQIVRSHDGTFALSPDRSEGTCFRVSLPHHWDLR